MTRISTSAIPHCIVIALLRLIVCLTLALVALPLGRVPFSASCAGSACAGARIAGAEAVPTRYVVFIVIDAGNPRYLHLTDLPHLQSLMQTGVVYDRAWVGQLASNTPSVHVTFGTGALPRTSGFPSFQWIEQSSRKKVDFRTLIQNGVMDSTLRAFSVPSVARRLHVADPHAVSVSLSSTKDYAAVSLGAGSADYELYGTLTKHHIVPSFRHTPPPLTSAERKALTQKVPFALTAKDRWAFDYAVAVARHLRPRLLMMNLPEVDTAGHHVGPGDSKVMSKLLINIDRGIGRLEDLYRSWGILDQTAFIVTADHSMMRSRPAPTTSAVGAAATTGKTPIALFGTADGAIWMRHPKQAPAFAARLARMKLPHVAAVYVRSKSGRTSTFRRATPLSLLAGPAVDRAYQYLTNTTAGRNGPDVWLIYREHYTPKSQNVSGLWKGTHGGASWDVQHVPLIMAGPGIQRGVHSQLPARAIDIAPTLERLLGLPTIPQEGVILADALSDSSDQERSSQDALSSILSAHVEALQEESRKDG